MKKQQEKLLFNFSLKKAPSNVTFDFPQDFLEVSDTSSDNEKAERKRNVPRSSAADAPKDFDAHLRRLQGYESDECKNAPLLEDRNLLSFLQVSKEELILVKGELLKHEELLDRSKRNDLHQLAQDSLKGKKLSLKGATVLFLLCDQDTHLFNKTIRGRHAFKDRSFPFEREAI